MLSSRFCRMSLAALAATGSIGAAAFLGAAGPASASSALVKSIKCSHLTGNIATTAKLTVCTGNTGGASKAMTVTTLEAGGPINWKNGKSTTIAAPTLTTGTKCPAGDTDEIAKAKVTADTTKSVTVGSTSTIEACVDSSGNLSLAPGTVAKI